MLSTGLKRFNRFSNHLLICRRGRDVSGISLFLGRLIQNENRTIVIVATAVFFTKFILAALTPLGYDFLLYTAAVISGERNVSWSPWILLSRQIYSIWYSLPVDHGNPAAAFVLSQPQLVSSDYLLSAMIKAPLIAGDMLAAFLIYATAHHITRVRKVAKSAAMLWLLNPLVTLLVEMWGSIDILVVVSVLATLLLLLRGSTKAAASPIVAGITLRLSPVLAWLPIAAWILHRDSPTRTSRIQSLVFVISGLVGCFLYFYWVSLGISFNSPAEFLNAIANMPYTPVTQSVSEDFAFLGYYFGITIITVVAYVLIATQVLPSREQVLIPVVLSTILVRFVTANFSPTELIWTMPLLAIWGTASGKRGYQAAFYFAAGLYLLAFYSDILTSNGSSFLFVPTQLVPQLAPLADLLRYGKMLMQYSGLQIRSLISGLSFAIAAYATWATARATQPVS